MGLRARVFLVIAAVALAAVVAVAVRSRDVAVVAFEEVRGPGALPGGPRLTTLQAPLEEAYARDGDWRDAQALLAKLLSGAGRDRFLLADGRGHVVASVPPGSGEAQLTVRADGAVEIESREAGGSRVSVLVGAPSLILWARDGTMAGRLVRLPPREADATPLADRFAGQLDRGLAAVAGLVLLLAWAAAWWLSRRLTRPLERLTDAARAIERGELEKRVSTRIRSGEPFTRLSAAWFGRCSSGL